LTQVTRYGTDATGTADGTITGGTSKIIGQMAYQNTDGVYATVASDIYGGQPLIWGDRALDKPREVGDLNFDGRDEVYGDYIESKTTRSGGSSGETTTTKRVYKRVIRFDSSGSRIDSKTIQIDTLAQDPPAYAGWDFSGPGRFLGSKNAMDFFLYDNKVNSTNNQGTPIFYSPTGALLLTDSQLGMTKFDCKPTPPSGYEADCNAVPATVTAPYPDSISFVADADGDGIDTVNIHDYNDHEIGVGDFLGNGHQQPLFRTPGPAAQKGVLSNGKWQRSGTSLGINCPTVFYQGSGTCALVDLNGDGATDLLRYDGNGGNVWLWLSTGVGFKSYSVSSISAGSIVLRDFDNDGRMDAIVIPSSLTPPPPQSKGSVKVYSLRPSSTAVAPVQFTLPTPITAGVVIGDFNGDGLPDFTNYTSMFISNPGTGNPNLVKQITTELGGTVAVEYTPSSTWANNYLPQVVHAVTKLSVGDGRGQTAVSTYQYSGGTYDPAARKFLGFASIVETKPLANGETAPSTVTTTYRQDLASYGLPSLTVWKDGAGAVHKQVAETYAVNVASKPYTVQNTATDTTLTENVSRTLRVERGFDAYNNITSLKDYGRTDASGDETWTQKWFAPNASAYTVSLPRIETVQAGLDNSFPFIRYKASFYDNQHADNNTPPTKGNLTWMADYNDLYGTPQKATHQFFAYDSYGNRISASNGLGHKTEWDYDATYHLYPITERAPRYFATGGQSADTRFVSSATYNPVCGLPATKTDPNGIVKTFTYDPFCRPYQVSQSVTGAYVATRFENEGNPGLQSIATY
ncbi:MULTISPECIES: toxin TcdB middle/N-terminal domain-containing protein, partial [unclassified Mesorhizobium]|uniref:toxin TcdB middle/N-terminal domain-containing protein n=1 Tax=unclassified Mesorhizobium TaxID=325217 RepID=UPI00167BA8C0